MNVYRQALSVREEQLPNNPHSALLVMATHTQNCSHIWGWSPAVAYPNMRQFIIKINASFPGPSSTCHPNKREPMEVISLSSIILTPSSVHCRGTGAFTVVCHACGKLEIRGGKKKKFDGQSDEVAQTGFSNGDVHLPFYAKYSLKNRCQLPDKGLLRWKLLRRTAIVTGDS